MYEFYLKLEDEIDNSPEIVLGKIANFFFFLVMKLTPDFNMNGTKVSL